MTKIILLLSAVLLSHFSFSQKKKDLKNAGIRAITVTETKGDKTFTDEKTLYNNEGEITKQTNYDKEGKLKSITKYKYNKKGDVIEETEYNDKNILKEKKEIKYNIIHKKTEEIISNKDNIVLKKIVFTYNTNGLKKERKSYDSLNNLISTKNYNYSYKKAEDEED